ncbi:MAG TPA: hypothetical protein PLG60_05185 [Acidimicrobiales bacterium]|nr:hypothetical protein [Acidimicrobiales bacterium]
MPRFPVRTLLALTTLGATLVATSGGAATPSGATILARALSNAAHSTSVTLSGRVSFPGSVVAVHDGLNAKGSAGYTTISGIGTEYVADRVGGPLVVKANSFNVLRDVLEVHAPTKRELNVWYAVTTSDPRYYGLAGTYGGLSLARSFSFSPAGWSRRATYEGVTTLHGVRVYKLKAASNTFAPGKGFNTTTLYVRDDAHPLPFAMTYSAQVPGFFYFSAWNHTTVAYATSTLKLPT